MCVHTCVWGISWGAYFYSKMMFHSLRSHLLCSTNQAALTSLLSGAELLLSVDLNTTPLCRVPDAHIYVDEYLCTDKEEQDFPTDGGNTTSRPTLESGSPSLGVSFATTTPLWTRPTRDPMEGVPPNRCTWVKQFSKGMLWWQSVSTWECVNWNEIDFCLSVLVQKRSYFSLNWSSSAHSHVGWIFASEERKTLVPGVFHMMAQVQAMFMMSLIQTIGCKKAAFTVIFFWLTNIVF